MTVSMEFAESGRNVMLAANHHPNDPRSFRELFSVVGHGKSAVAFIVKSTLLIRHGDGFTDCDKTAELFMDFNEALTAFQGGFAEYC